MGDNAGTVRRRTLRPNSRHARLMHPSADLIELIFLSAVVLYLLVECFLTARQILSAERSVGRVPEGFDAKLSLAAHKKAAAFTIETAQANLVLAFAAAGLALLMTMGRGLTFLAAFYETLFTNTLIVEWLLVATVLGLLLLFELPVDLYARCLVKERFGYMRHTRREWLRRRFLKSAAGWAAALPLTAFALALFEVCGRWWWLALWGFLLLTLLWRWRVSLIEDRAWSRVSRPVLSKDLRELFRDFLAAHGYRMEDVVLMTRPGAWKHAHVLLTGTGDNRRVVVFAHAAGRLTREELLAVLAQQIARVRGRHAAWRITFNAAAGLLVCAFAGWGAQSPELFAGLGFSPALTTAQPGVHAGFMTALGLVVFPVLFFALRPLVNFGARRLLYASDYFAMRAVGAAPLVRALVKLHRDYAQTLTPSRVYSLFHHARPHAGMRVKEILRAAKRGGWPLDQPSDLVRFRAAPYLDHEHPERTVLAEEQRLRRAQRPETPADRRRREAEELARSLEVEHPLVVDDGLDEATNEPEAPEAHDPPADSPETKPSAQSEPPAASPAPEPTAPKKT